jgi:hypothetical protein
MLVAALSIKTKANEHLPQLTATTAVALGEAQSKGAVREAEATAPCQGLGDPVGGEDRGRRTGPKEALAVVGEHRGEQHLFGPVAHIERLDCCLVPSHGHLQ